MNRSDKITKSLVKSNGSAAATNRSTVSSIKPGKTTSDVVVVTKQVAETKKEIETLKAELQKLINNGVKNNITNNAINLRNNKNIRPIQVEPKETIKTSINDLNYKETSAQATKVNKENVSKCDQTKFTSPVAKPTQQQELNIFNAPNFMKSTIAARRTKSSSPRKSTSQLHTPQKPTERNKILISCARNLNNAYSKGDANERSASPPPSKQEHQIVPVLNAPPPPHVTVRRRSVGIMSRSPTRAVTLKPRSSSSEKEKTSQKQTYYDPDLMKEYIKKQRHDRFVKHKEEAAEKAKHEVDKKQKLKELQQKTNKIFMKNVKSAATKTSSRTRVPDSGGDCPEYLLFGGGGHRSAGGGGAQCDEVTFRKRPPVVVDGILAQSDEFFISSLRKPHVSSRSLQKEHVSRIDQMCSKNHQTRDQTKSRDRSKEVPAQTPKCKSATDSQLNAAKTEKLNIPSTVLLKNVDIIKKKRLEERHKAATKIQATYKGYRQRLVYRKVVQIRKRREEEAKKLAENYPKLEVHFETESIKSNRLTDSSQNPFVQAQKQTPKWLQPAVSLPYPYNFITAVKRKLNLAVNNINTTDSGTQYSPNVSLTEETEPKVQNFDTGQQNAQKTVTPENVKPEVVVVHERANKKKQVDLKSFLSQKCLNLDLRPIEPLTLNASSHSNNNNNSSSNNLKRDKLPLEKASSLDASKSSVSESDTTKHVPDISDESVSNVTSSSEDRILETECDRLKMMPLGKVENQNTRQAVQNALTKHSDKSSKTKHTNRPKRFAKHDSLIAPNDSLLVRARPDGPVAHAQINDVSAPTKTTAVVADDLNWSVSSQEKNASILINYWNSVSKNTGANQQNSKAASLVLSLSKTNNNTSSNAANLTERFEENDAQLSASDKEDKSFKSLNVESDGSAKSKTSETISDRSTTTKSSGSQIKTNISQRRSITYRNSHKSSTNTIEENKYSSDFTNTFTKTSSPSTVPSLKRPSISLQSSHIVTEEIGSPSIKSAASKASLQHSSVHTECQSNQIHLKFEAELHLLDSANNSLREVMAAEKSQMDINQNKNTMHQNKDTQTLRVSKKPSEPQISQQSSITTVTSAKTISSINFSRGSDISEDLLSSLENASAFKDLSCTDINLSQFNDTSALMNDTVDLFKANKFSPGNIYTGISLGMFDQLIKEEDARIENLQQMCKIREQALNCRTKGEVYMLEIKRKALKDKGQKHEACQVKKKQRGLLIKLENEKHELHRLRQMNKAVSLERKTILKEQRNLIKAQLSATSNMVPKIRRSSGSLDRRNSGPIKVYKNRTDAVLSETSFSCKSSVSEEVVSSARSVGTRTSEERRTERPDRSALRNRITAETDVGQVKPSIRADTLKRSLLMREAALQKRRKAAEDLLQWHRRLTEEENKITELESKANALLSEAPNVAKSKSGSPSQDAYDFNGAQLNLLWQNMTGREENKFDNAKTYTMSKIALENFCKDARKQTVSQMRADRRPSADSATLTSDSAKGGDESCEEEIQSVQSSIKCGSEFLEENNSNSKQPPANDNSIIENSIKCNDRIELSEATEGDDDSVADIRNSVLDSSCRSVDVSVESERMPSENVEIATKTPSSGDDLAISPEVQSIVNSIISVATSAAAEKTRSIKNRNEEETHHSMMTPLISSSIALQKSPQKLSISSDDRVSELQNCSDGTVTLLVNGTDSIQEKIETVPRINAEHSTHMQYTYNETADYSTNFEDNVESITTAETVKSSVSKNETLERSLTHQNVTNDDESTPKEVEEQVRSARSATAETATETETEVPSLSVAKESLKSCVEELIVNVAAINSVSEDVPEEKTSPLKTPEKPAEAIVVPSSSSSPNDDDESMASSIIVSEYCASDSAAEEESVSPKVVVVVAAACGERANSNSHESKSVSRLEDAEIFEETTDKTERSASPSAADDAVAAEAVWSSPSAADDAAAGEQQNASAESKNVSSEESEEYVTTQEDASANSTEEEGGERAEDKRHKAEGITHVDVRKRVSEILADANNTPTRDHCSPRLQDLYVTAYDVMSPTDEHSPELGSPNDSSVSTENSAIPAEIFGEEAEELLRKQLAIEREIKELEKQQKEQLPYLFVREIPNKPPPPYTPPVLNVTPPVTSVMPTSEQQIDAIVAKATVHLYDAYCTDSLERCSPPASAAAALEAAHMRIANVSEDCCQFVFDLCKEIAVEHCRLFRSKDCSGGGGGGRRPSWMHLENKFSAVAMMQKPLNREALQAYVGAKVKQLLGMDGAPKVDKMAVKWSNKKRDHVDELLVLESQAEEAEWTNYDEDELIVKNELTNDIFDMLLDETADVVNDILVRKSFLF